MRQPPSPGQGHQGQGSEPPFGEGVRETILLASAPACLCARMSPLVHRDTLRDERSQPSGLNDQETEAQRGVSAWERPSVFQNSLPSPVCMLPAKHTFVL